MSPRTARRLTCLGTIGTIAIGTGAALTLYCLLRTPPAWVPPELDVRPTPASPQDRPAAPQLADLAVIWQRDLRQPLADPPPPKPPEPVPEPKLTVRLVGTAIEGNRQYGLFQVGNNPTVVKAAGASVEGFEIVSIARGRARLRSGAREYELTVPWYERLQAEERDGH